MLNLADKSFKAAIINIFEQLKETMSRGLKKTVMTMTHNVENTIKLEIILKM